MHSSAAQALDLTAVSPALGLLPQPRLRPAAPPRGPVEPPRPLLRLVEGGLSQRRAAERAYRRRRTIALLGLVTAIALTFVLVDAISTRLADGGTPSSAVGAPSPTSADASGAAGVAASGEVVVRPGDTLWSIAADVAPEVDVRITVDRLLALNGPLPIVVGQRLAVPA